MGAPIVEAITASASRTRTHDATSTSPRQSHQTTCPRITARSAACSASRGEVSGGSTHRNVSTWLRRGVRGTGNRGGGGRRWTGRRGTGTACRTWWRGQRTRARSSCTRTRPRRRASDSSPHSARSWPWRSVDRQASHRRHGMSRRWRLARRETFTAPPRRTAAAACPPTGSGRHVGAAAGRRCAPSHAQAATRSAQTRRTSTAPRDRSRRPPLVEQCHRSRERRAQEPGDAIGYHPRLGLRVRVET